MTLRDCRFLCQVGEGKASTSNSVSSDLTNANDLRNEILGIKVMMYTKKNVIETTIQKRVIISIISNIARNTIIKI